LNNETAITQFKESANVVTQEIDGKMYLERISNPFPDQTPSQVLERVYRIDSFTWTSGLANRYYKFPDALAALSVISSYLTPFRYYRADIRLHIRMNSTPYHQGSLIVATLPTIDMSGTDSIWNPYTLSGCKPIVLSASVQDSCTIDLPYLNPAPWMSIASLASCSIGTITIAELNPLTSTSTGIPASVEVLVFASFVNPKVAQFNETVSAQSMRSPFSRFGMLKVDHPNLEAKRKAQDGVDSKVAGKIIGGVSEVIKMIPIIGDIYRPIANFISTYGRNLDMPNDTQATTVIFDYPFRYQNQTSGLFQGEKFTMFPSTQLALENFQMESSEMSLAALAGTPMLIQQITFTANGQTVAFNVNPMALMQANSFNTCDYLQFTAAHFEYWRGSIKFMFHFISSAFYSARFQIAYQLNNGTNIDANLPNQIIDVKGDTITEVTIPFLWYTYWRKTGTNPTSLPTLQIRMITPIAGSTAPANPFIYMNVWRAGGEDTQFAQLKNSQSTLPWNPPSQEFKVKAKKKEAIVAQTSICTRFKSSFHPIIEDCQFSLEVGNCMQEVPGTLKDVIRRFSLMDPRNWASSTDFSQPYIAPFVTAPFYAEPFSAFQHIFLFWRGSRRFRISPNASDNVVLNSGDASMTPTPGSGMVITNQNVSQNDVDDAIPLTLQKTEFEAPFFSEVPYFPIFRPIVPLTYNPIYDRPVGITVNQNNLLSDTPALPRLLLWAAGDDFQYLYLIPPIFPASSQKRQQRSDGDGLDRVYVREVISATSKKSP
jgi:hypothetical protein